MKGLTHAFSRFLDQFQSFEISSQYERLNKISYFGIDYSRFKVKLSSIFDAEKFRKKVKGLTHGF